MKDIIELQNVTIRYGQTEAVNDVSCGIAAGDFVGLAGPNGAGKTTLLKALLGLIPTEKGRITLFGKPLKSFKDWQKIGYLPQKSSTINQLFPATVEEAVFIGLLSSKKIPKIITRKDREKISKALHELEIFDLKDKMLAELSSGQQQRALLARCLVAEPEILFFDEPSTALDPKSREAFFELIKKLNKEKGITVILITHDIGNIGEYANKLLYLDKKLVYFGGYAEFCRSKKMHSRLGHIICHQHH